MKLFLNIDKNWMTKTYLNKTLEFKLMHILWNYAYDCTKLNKLSWE